MNQLNIIGYVWVAIALIMLLINPEDSLVILWGALVIANVYFAASIVVAKMESIYKKEMHGKVY